MYKHLFLQYSYIIYKRILYYVISPGYEDIFILNLEISHKKLYHKLSIFFI